MTFSIFFFCFFDSIVVFQSIVINDHKNPITSFKKHIKISFRYQLNYILIYNIVPTRRNYELHMAFAYQLELFEDNDPVSLLQKDFRILEKSCHSVRRGVFAEVTAFKDEIHLLRDLCISMKSEIEMLKNKLEVKAEVIEFPIGGMNESRNSG